jgi:type VI protein secretion system component Hcp
MSCGKCARTSDGRWLVMEPTMSKNNDTSNLDHRELTDIELDAVTGGKLIDAATPKLYEAALKGKVFTKVEIHGTA